MYTKHELYEEIIIAKEGEWSERFSQLTELFYNTFGVAYWDYEEQLTEATTIPEGAEKHYKHTRSVGECGHYIFTPVETEFHEITFNYTSETFVTVVFNDQLNIIKIVASGKGSRSKTEELKQWGLNKFNESIN